jgi:hypothetical protein
MNLLRSRCNRGGALLATFAFLLPLFTALLTISPTTVLAAEPAIGTSGSASAGPVQTVHGTRTDKPPTLTADQQAKVEAATEKSNKPGTPIPDDPNAKRLSTPPTAPSYDPKKSTPPTKQKASDFVAFENNTFPAGGLRSTTDEPSVANSGSTIFWTANWYDAVSTDGGTTWSYISPFTFFPSTFGGFCCDQTVIYDPTRNLFIWTLQYITDGTNSNAVRVAVAHGASGVISNTWNYFDLTGGQVGYPTPPGVELDYPNVALSANDWYYSTNVFLGGSGSSSTGVVFRIPLANLNALTTGGTLPYTFYIGPFTMVPTQGAGTTMYFGANTSTSSITLVTWPETSSSPTSTTVSHAAFATGTHVCTSPDSFNPCQRDDSRVKTGWVAKGVIGFMWDAAQGSGGLGNFAYPYVHVVRINQATSALIDEPVIYSPLAAYGWPGVGVNGRGDIGGSIMFGGGGNYPGSSIFIQDEFNTAPWEFQFTAFGTNSPSSSPGRWGDYLTARPADGNGNTWIGTSFTLQGACTGGGNACANVAPRYLRFGRQRDNPFFGKEALSGVWRGGAWYLENSLVASGPLSYAFLYGNSTNQVLMCDWRGNGQKTPAVYINGVFYISYTYTGTLDLVVPFGGTGATPVCGDWNGTGSQKIGVFNNGVWALSFSNTSPAANIVAYFGGTGAVPVVGDWNGTGTQKIGIYQNGIWALSFSNTTPAVNVFTGFGNASQKPIVGDWDRNGTETIGIFQNGVWALSNSNTAPVVNYYFAFGSPGDIPLNWR